MEDDLWAVALTWCGEYQWYTASEVQARALRELGQVLTDYGWESITPSQLHLLAARVDEYGPSERDS